MIAFFCFALEEGRRDFNIRERFISFYVSFASASTPVT